MKALRWFAWLPFLACGGNVEEARFAAMTAKCKLRVERECNWTDGAPDEDCKALKECDAKVDAWEAGK